MQWAALLHFAAGLGVLVWQASASSVSAPVLVRPIEPSLPIRLPAAIVKPPLRSLDTRALNTLAELVACLEAGGGVSEGRCVWAIEVIGVSDAPSLNARYFSASKAGPLFAADVDPPGRAVSKEVQRCEQAGAPALPCVLEAFTLRTRQPQTLDEMAGARHLFVGTSSHDDE